MIQYDIMKTIELLECVPSSFNHELYSNDPSINKNLCWRTIKTISANSFCKKEHVVVSSFISQ